MVMVMLLAGWIKYNQNKKNQSQAKPNQTFIHMSELLDYILVDAMDAC